MKPLMKCGHTAHARDEHGNPACIICNCTEVEENKPDLTDRKARCSYHGQTFTRCNGQTITCHGEADSSYRLPFFEHKPESEFDAYYCGCWGWD